jgi:hypothetical protein
MINHRNSKVLRWPHRLLQLTIFYLRMIVFCFFKESGEGAKELSSLVNDYCQASVQQINKYNSLIFFTMGCPEPNQDPIKEILEVNNEALNERYLGTSINVGSSRYGTFKFLRDRVWSKVEGWLEKILSARGKRSSLNRLPQFIYFHCFFRLPRGLGEHINSPTYQFWLPRRFTTLGVLFWSWLPFVAEHSLFYEYSCKHSC